VRLIARIHARSFGTGQDALSRPPNRDLAKPYSVSLGPGPDDFSIIGSFRYEATPNTPIRYQDEWERSESYASNPELRRIRDFFTEDDSFGHPSRWRLVHGPNSSYWATKGSKWIASPTGLPPSFLALLERDGRRQIKEVALGYGGAWWVQYVDRTCE